MSESARTPALNVQVFGPDEGRPVLALHGITGHALRWAGLAGLLPELRVLAVDLRGHGHSPWTPPWSIEQHVADALEVLDAFRLDRVPVIGHSFGGAIAVHLGRTAPERVERLVLLDPAIGLDPADALEGATEAGIPETFADAAAARASRIQRWEAGLDAAADAEIEQHLVEEDGRLRFRYAAPAIVTAWSEMARPAVTPPADLPTLLLPAVKADLVKPAWVRRMRDELGERLVVEELDCGHMVYFERPAETAAAIRTFLNG